MKKLALIAAGIFLGAWGSVAQTSNCDLQAGKCITATGHSQNKVYSSLSFYKISAVQLRHRPLKRFGSIPVTALGCGFDNCGKRQPANLNLRTAFAAGYKVKPVNNISPARPTADIDVVNAGILKPKQAQEVVDIDNSGMNIGITKNTSINLGISFSDDDSATANSVASSYVSHDMDVSVSLVLGLR